MLTVEHIQRTVAEHYGLSLSDMRSAYRARKLAWPRQVAMSLSRQMTGRSLPDIGRRFGGRDHTTVMHSIRRVAQRCASDPDYAVEVGYIRDKAQDGSALTTTRQTVCAVLGSLQQFYRALARLDGCIWPNPREDWKGVTELLSALESIGAATVAIGKIKPRETSPTFHYGQRTYVTPELNALRAASALAREARQ